MSDSRLKKWVKVLERCIKRAQYLGLDVQTDFNIKEEINRHLDMLPSFNSGDSLVEAIRVFLKQEGVSHVEFKSVLEKFRYDNEEISRVLTKVLASEYHDLKTKKGYAEVWYYNPHCVKERKGNEFSRHPHSGWKVHFSFHEDSHVLGCNALLKIVHELEWEGTSVHTKFWVRSINPEQQGKNAVLYFDAPIKLGEKTAKPYMNIPEIVQRIYKEMKSTGVRLTTTAAGDAEFPLIVNGQVQYIEGIGYRCDKNIQGGYITAEQSDSYNPGKRLDPVKEYYRYQNINIELKQIPRKPTQLVQKFKRSDALAYLKSMQRKSKPDDGNTTYRLDGTKNAMTRIGGNFGSNFVAAFTGAPPVIGDVLGAFTEFLHDMRDVTGSWRQTADKFTITARSVVNSAKAVPGQLVLIFQRVGAEIWAVVYSIAGAGYNLVMQNVFRLQTAANTARGFVFSIAGRVFAPAITAAAVKVGVIVSMILAVAAACIGICYCCTVLNEALKYEFKRHQVYKPKTIYIQGRGYTTLYSCTENRKTISEFFDRRHWMSNRTKFKGNLFKHFNLSKKWTFVGSIFWARYHCYR